MRQKKKSNWKPYALAINILLTVIIAQSCAQFSTPRGGPDDETAPMLNTAESTPNKQTNFETQKIELVYDEWIQLKNPIKEVFISPPLSYPPQIVSRGKKVTFEFSEEEVLKDNTTYQINFGQSIKDLTAGNPIDNFVFLFSTGDEIDSLSLGGQVVDSEDGKGLEDIIVMLYDDLSDTCFTTNKPLYLTRTTEDGKFRLENLRSDTFQIYALKDENVSYTYDLPTEQVAYSDSLLILKDTTLQTIELSLFDEEDVPLLIEARQRQRGLINVIYQPPLEDYKLVYLPDTSARQYIEEAMDTIKLWHDDLDADSTFVIVVHEDNRDTLKIRTGKDSIAKRPLKVLTKKIELLKDDTIYIQTNKPLNSVDTSLITISDTTGVLRLEGMGVKEKSIWVTAKMANASSYSLKIDSAAVMDWYGSRNKDSLVLDVITYDPEIFGNITLDIVKSDSLSYIVELYKGDAVLKRETVTTSESFRLKTALPGKYKLKIIQDENRDGRWSAGSLAKKKQPETIKELNLEELKPGWDLEDTVDLQEIFYGAGSK